MKLTLVAVVVGIAFAAAVLGLNLPGATSARVPAGIAERQDEVPKAASAPSSHNVAVVAAHDDSNTEQTHHSLNGHLITGDSTLICTTDKNYFANLKQAIDIWNVKLLSLGVGSKTQPVFSLHSGPSDSRPSSCADAGTRDVHVIVKHRAPASVGSCPGTTPCYLKVRGTAAKPRQQFRRRSDVRQETGEAAAEIVIPKTTVTVPTLVHELGHVLGLSDYTRDNSPGNDACDGLVVRSGSGIADPDPTNQHYALMYNAGDRDCRPPAQATISGRDLRDLYEAYHVGAITNVHLSADAAASGGRLTLPFSWGSTGVAEASHNASHVAIFGRDVSAAGVPGQWMPIDDKLVFDGQADVTPVMGLTITATAYDEYKIVGVTRGDVRWQGLRIQPGTAASIREFDRTVRLTVERPDGQPKITATFIEGDPTIVAGLKAGTSRILSASLSPRYCWAGDDLVPAVLIRGGATPRTRALQDLDGTGFSTSLIGNCGSTAGVKEFKVQGAWGAGSSKQTAEITLKVGVHDKPTSLRLASKAPQPTTCTSARDFQVGWEVSGGTGTQRVWIGETLDADSLDADGASPASVTCPSSATSAFKLSGFVLDSAGAGAYWTAPTLTVVPDPFENMQITNVTPTSATMAGLAPIVVGVAPTALSHYYEVRQDGVTVRAPNSLFPLQVSSSSHTFEGLTPNTTYTLGVRLVTNEAPGAEWTDRRVKTFTHEAPAGLKLSVSGTSATLTWTAVTGLSYEVQVRQSEQQTVRPALGGSHTFSGLTAGAELYVRVKGTGANVDYGGSAWAPALAVPAGLTSAGVSTSRIVLRWTAVSGADGYDLRYRTGSGTWIEQTGLRFPFLVLQGLEGGTRYEFQVRSRQAAVRSDWSGAIFRTTTGARVLAPAQPSNLQVSLTATSAELSWNAATRATSYAAKACTGSGTSASCQTVTVTATAHTFTGLTPSTSYTFSVVAKNAGGDSPAATITKSTAAAPPALAVPSGLGASLTAPGLVSLRWTAVTGADGYDLRYRTGSGTWTERLGLTTDFELVTGLSAATRYEFQVRARKGDARSGWSASFFQTTPRASVAAPPEPTGLQVSLTATTASLSWDRAPRATSYAVQACTGSGAGETCLSDETTNINHRFTGLTPSTSYTFSVVAKNSGGDSTAATISGTTRASSVLKPPPATGLSATTTATGAELSWNAAARATGYEVKACAAGACLTETVTTTSHTFSGLTPSTSYTFSVVAKNSGGDATAATVAKSTPAAPPSLAAPTGLQLSGVGSSEARLSWGRVAAAASYEVKACVGANCVEAAVSQTARGRPAHSFSGLTPAASYTFSVRARAGATLSDWSELSRRTAAALRVRARRLADGRVELGLRLWGDVDLQPRNRFAALTDLTHGRWRSSETLSRMIDGTTYQLGRVSVRLENRVCPAQVRVSFRPASGAARIIPTQHSFPVTTAAGSWRLSSWFDLELGTTAGASDGATGAEGSALETGPAAASAGADGGLMDAGGAVLSGQSASTGCAAAPSGLALSGVSQTGASLSWTAVAGASQYDVRVDGGEETELAATTTSNAFSGLEAGGSYSLEVRARSAGGASGWSARSVTLPPPEPANVEAGSATTSSLSLSWDGSAGATSYEVKRSGSTAVGTKAASDRSHAFGGLSAATGYTLSVRALNAGGASDWVPAGATTDPIDPPTGLSVQATSTSAALSWNASTEATSYDVSACAGATCKRASATGASHTFTGLTPSTAYAFSVAVRNSAGVSAPLTVRATTQAAAVQKPPTPTGLSVTTTATGASLSWNAAARATSYDVSACAGASCKQETPTATNQAFSGLTPSTEYTFSVAARNAGGLSTAATLKQRTQAATFTLTGRMEARRVTSGRVELAFTPAGGSRIRPSSRYLNPSSANPGTWYKSSAVSGTVGGVTRTFGRITARLVATTSSRYFEICFIPHGGTRACPSGRVFFYRDSSTVVNTWYWTGSRSYTATIGGQLSGIAAGELMAELPAGADDPAGPTGGAMADLVPTDSQEAPEPPG